MSIYYRKMTEAKARREQQTTPSPLALVLRWLQMKNYQYEVTFSLYMLTRIEKIVFNSILLILTSLLVTAAYFYLPAHVFIIYTRVWYYISGEFSHHGSHINGTNMLHSLGSAIQATKEVFLTQAASSIAARQTLGQATRDVLRDEL